MYNFFIAASSRISSRYSTCCQTPAPHSGTPAHALTQVLRCWEVVDALLAEALVKRTICLQGSDLDGSLVDMDISPQEKPEEWLG
jgi:hypothetical protein